MRLRQKTSWLALVFLAVLACWPDLAPARRPMVGGPCSYADFPGTATIVEVSPEAKPANSSQAYEPYQVLFTYAPAPGTSSEAAKYTGKSFHLTLSGGLAPGPLFLRKYGVRPGAFFPCVLHLMRTGTCSPVVFSFQGLDVFDFFELTQPGK